MVTFENRKPFRKPDQGRPFEYLTRPVFGSPLYLKRKIGTLIQARIAQLVAYRLGIGEVLGSNPGKGENYSVKIINRIIQN